MLIASWSPAAVVNEALLAYNLNIGLFDAMEARAAESAKSDKAEDYTLESSLKTPESGLENTYSVASVVALITAGTPESNTFL
jgi:hypothetical protein